MKDLTIKELRGKYPKLEGYLNTTVAMSRETVKGLEDNIRHLEADLKIEKIKRKAIETELHYEYESFMGRAIRIAEQY